jgi:hypothetical protein
MAYPGRLFIKELTITVNKNKSDNMTDKKVNDTNYDYDEDASPVHQDLHRIAEENSISTEGEKAISKVIAGFEWHWSQIPKEEAVKVMTEIQLHGIEEVQGWALKGEKPEDSGQEQEAAEVSSDPETLPEVRNMEPDEADAQLYAEASQVLDDATGEVVSVTEGMRNWAFRIHNYMEADAINKAFIWSIFRSQRLYLAFGCSSMKDYAEERSSVSYRTIMNYLDIGNRYFPALKEVSSATVALEEDPETFLKELQDDPEVAKLAKLGTRKLIEIGKQGDDKVKQLVEQKEVTFDDGTTLSYEELVASTTKELEQRYRQESKAKNKRIANLEEDKLAARSERDHYREERDQLQEELDENAQAIKRSQELANTYAEADTNIKQAFEALDEMKQLLREAELVFGPIDTIGWDYVPETLKEEVRNVLHIIHRMQLTAQDRFAFLYEDISNLEEFPSWKVKGGDGKPDWMPDDMSQFGQYDQEAEGSGSGQETAAGGSGSGQEDYS